MTAASKLRSARQIQPAKSYYPVHGRMSILAHGLKLKYTDKKEKVFFFSNRQQVKKVCDIPSHSEFQKIEAASILRNCEKWGYVAPVNYSTIVNPALGLKSLEIPDL